MRNNTLLFRTIYWGSPCGLDILTKIRTKIDEQLSFSSRRGKFADNQNFLLIDLNFFLISATLGIAQTSRVARHWRRLSTQ